VSERRLVAFDPIPTVHPLFFHKFSASYEGSTCLVSASITYPVGSCCCTQLFPRQREGIEGGKVRRISGPGDRDCCKELRGPEIVPNPNRSLLLQYALQSKTGDKTFSCP